MSDEIASTTTTMWAVGQLKSKYSKDHMPPITLVRDRATAESLQALLATAEAQPYIIEVPLWPLLRKTDEE